MSQQSNTFHWISSFLEAQAAELGAATNTQLAYGRDLKDFDGWLARRELDFMSAQQADVEGYLIHCEAQGPCQIHPRASAVSGQATLSFCL